MLDSIFDMLDSIFDMLDSIFDVIDSIWHHHFYYSFLVNDD